MPTHAMFHPWWPRQNFPNDLTRVEDTCKESVLHLRAEKHRVCRQYSGKKILRLPSTHLCVSNNLPPRRQESQAPLSEELIFSIYFSGVLTYALRFFLKDKSLVHIFAIHTECETISTDALPFLRTLTTVTWIY
jgi:hypothetical protein